jgi:stage II sporulation protein D
LRPALALACVAALAMPVTADLPPSRLWRFGEPGRRSRALEASVGRKVRTTTDLVLRVGFAQPGGYTVAALPLETYVARVLAGEAARDSQPAALDALAITVRTYALANRTRHKLDGFDLCDQTHCQVLRAATVATDRAAERTAGLVLTHDGTPASIYYTASCGGRTETPSAVWPGAADPPYLPSQTDDACGGAPAWTAAVAGVDLLRALRAAGFRGDRLRDMRIVARDKSGRVARLELKGLLPDWISGQDLRVAAGRTLGWQHIRSTAFDLRHAADVYQFTGRGSGHGVGLCVIGSVRLAADGKSAAEILGRYFPGLEISPLAGRLTAVAAAPADLMMALPDGDEGSRTLVEALIRRARDDLANVLGVRAPARVTVRVHSTIVSFERAAAQPWFTLGAVISGEVHLLPLTVLRERGILERTIRHELVRVMTNAELARRPLWVREGAAAYFAGRADEVPLPTRAECPSDAELSHPISIGALGNAYARARVCVARQIAAGKSWREVK